MNAVRRTAHGRTLNPALPEEISGVGFHNLKPTRATVARHGLTISRLPCPYRRQHAASKDAGAIARLDRLFAKQRATLRKATGKPYFVDHEQDRVSAALLARGLALGMVQL